LPSPVPPASAQIVPPLQPLASTALPASAPPAPPAPDRRGPRAVSAPLPGVVIAVPAQLGQQIVAGQELCVLEAMKMLNTVRAQRAGQIAAVHVTVGQHVQYNDVLFEYAD
jgi:biotin carboxyl carrier protein